MNYEKINLADYDLRGEGGTAQTYYSKDGQRLAKLFFNQIGADTAIREFHIAQAVHRMGIPTPRPIRLITDGQRIGTELELFAPVGKRSFARIMSEEPDQVEPLSREFAQRARQLHQTPADTSILPSMKSLIRHWIDRCPEIPADILDLMERTLDETPDQATCLHGDLHVGNIISDGQHRMWIDVGDFSYGIPEWDNCMLYVMGNIMSEERCQNLFHFSSDTMHQHWLYFLREYYSLASPEAYRDMEPLMRRLAATKLFFVATKNSNGAPVSEGLANIIRKIAEI